MKLNIWWGWAVSLNIMYPSLPSYLWKGHVILWDSWREVLCQKCISGNRGWGTSYSLGIGFFGYWNFSEICRWKAKVERGANQVSAACNWSIHVFENLGFFYHRMRRSKIDRRYVVYRERTLCCRWACLTCGWEHHRLLLWGTEVVCRPVLRTCLCFWDVCWRTYASLIKKLAENLSSWKAYLKLTKESWQRWFPTNLTHETRIRNFLEEMLSVGFHKMLCVSPSRIDYKSL